MKECKDIKKKLSPDKRSPSIKEDSNQAKNETMRIIMIGTKTQSIYIEM